MRGQLKLTEDDKIWANLVKERDGRKCVICSETERLNAHHIFPREIKELKFDIYNGISLCPNHHFFSRKISAHNNPVALFLWLLENREEQIEILIKKWDIIKNDL